MEKKVAVPTIGGSALIFGGCWLADKTLAYVWENILNLLTAGTADQVTWQTFPFRNTIGVVSILAGAAVLLWPFIKNHFSRSPSGEVQINEAIQAHKAEIDSVHNRFGELLNQQSGELRKLTAIQSTNIENLKTLDARQSEINKRLEAYQSKVGAVFEFVSALAKADFRTELAARIEWAEKLLDMAHVKFNAREYSGAVEQIRITIGKYGFSLADIDEEIAASAFAIRNDPACYVLKEGDVWTDEEAKRQWHLNKGELDGYRRLLSHASGTPSNQALSVIMSRDIS